MVICIDFDGTCVSHEFPAIGEDIGAVPVLKALTDKGHQLVLFTMRSDMLSPTSDDYNIKGTGDAYLSQAVAWFEDNGIPLFGVNSNPTQSSWTESPKAYGGMYIDDLALGCPLIYPADSSKPPYVDWLEI